MKRSSQPPSPSESDSTPTRNSSPHSWKTSIAAGCHVLEEIWRETPRENRIAFLQRDKRAAGKRICRDDGSSNGKTVLFIKDITFLIFELLSDLDIINFSSTCKFMRSVFKSCQFISSVNPLSRRFVFDANSHIHSLVARIDIEDARYTLQFDGRIPLTSYEFLDLRFYDAPTSDGVRRVSAHPRIDMTRLLPKNQCLRQVQILPSPGCANEVNQALAALCRQDPPPNIVFVNDTQSVDLYGATSLSDTVINLIVVRCYPPYQFEMKSMQYELFGNTVMIVDEKMAVRAISHRGSMPGWCYVYRNELSQRPACGGKCQLCKFVSTRPKWETSVFLKEFGNGEPRLFRRT